MKDFLIDTAITLLIILFATVGGAVFGMVVTGNLHL